MRCTMDEIHPSISFGEYSAFHAIDRALYFALAFDLWRDPIESIEVMALWILFERLGLFKNFVNFMLSKHPSMVAQFADEAIACLQTIKEEGNHSSAKICEIPLTSNLLRSNISLQYFSKNRATLGRELGKIISNVCAKAFPDILRDALVSHAAYDAWVEDMVAAAAFSESPKEDRTMFVTFSRGYPVNEVEVRVLFTTLFGVDCIEAFYMQKTPSPDEQPLYARIIFTRTEVVDTILNGAEKAKLTVNKKHLWLRKYVTQPRTTPA